MQLLAQQLNSFFFNDTATTEIYPLSLHDALPIYQELSHFLQHLWQPLHSLAHSLLLPVDLGLTLRLLKATRSPLHNQQSLRLNAIDTEKSRVMIPLP